MRLEGEGAWGLTKMFLELWAQLGGSFEEETDYYRPQLHVDGAGFCQPLCDGPDNNPVNTAEDTFLHLITSANESVYITTPYLAIDEAMMRALCLAADSGVDVRLMMPGIEPPSTFERVTEATFSSFSGFTFDRAPVTDSFFWTP